MIRRSPQFTALLATLLALAVATGVSTPRLRTAGRDRVARSAALAGSTRSDQPCAWIEPDDDDELQMASAGDLVFDTRVAASSPELAGPFAVVAAGVAVAHPPASTVATPLPLHLAADRVAVRPATARGPPPFLT